MKSIVNLFKMVQATRGMTLIGWALRGISRDQQSNLAEHHYLVTFISWRLALLAKRSGGIIDVQKVLEISLIHDLGETLGGDIPMPYGRRFPKARELAKAYEEHNQMYITSLFDDEEPYVKELFEEANAQTTDEGLVAKIGDYLELNHYLVFIKKFSEHDLEFIYSSLQGLSSKIHDKKTKFVIQNFLKNWKDEIFGKDVIDIISGI